MGWLLITILLSSEPVSDDWQAVRSALLPALKNIPLSVSDDTLMVVPMGENPYNWVFQPILEEYLSEIGVIVTTTANAKLRFHPVNLQIEKKVVGFMNSKVKRTVKVKLWISYQTTGGTRQWLVSGKYNDTFPLSNAELTYVEGLSPEIEKETGVMVQLVSAVFLAGLLYFIYSGGQ